MFLTHSNDDNLASAEAETKYTHARMPRGPRSTLDRVGTSECLFSRVDRHRLPLDCVCSLVEVPASSTQAHTHTTRHCNQIADLNIVVRLLVVVAISAIA